ncbi:ABC transporter permease [Halovulum sp. GXIMD14793]
MSVATRIAFRELRGGLSGFRIFLLCLALGVAAITAVGSVQKAIQTGLEREASALLGGDAEMRFTYRHVNAEELAWMNEQAQQVSQIVDFRSMLVTGDQRALTQVKGVDEAYPIYGEVKLDPPMPVTQALETRDGLAGLVAEKVLLDRLGLQPGDIVMLGAREYELRAALMYEPDGATAGFSLGPRVIVAEAALDGSGLLAAGTLYESSYRLRLDPGANLSALGIEAKETFRDSGLRWRDRRNGTPSISRFVDRLGAFLVLVGLAGLAVGGVGVSAAVRAYLERKTATIATLKTLGASGNTIFAVYLIQIGLLAILGIAAGVLLGAALPAMLGPVLSSNLPVPAMFGFYAEPMIEAAFYGLMTALIFTLWPLARARDLRAAGLFRDAATENHGLPRPVYLLLIGALAALLVLAVVTLSGIPTLAIGAAAGIVGSLFILSLAATGMRRLARRLSRSRAARGAPAWRLALGSVGGPGGETTSVVLSLGLGLTVLAAIGQIDSNLRGVIEQDLPDVAPAYFFLDIQNEQLPGFKQIATSEPGVDKVESAPMLRGVITKLNGEDPFKVLQERTNGAQTSHWVLRGDRGVTYADAPPEGATITEGAWWNKDYSGPPVMAFAEEEARELGIGIGDKVTVNILGREITAEIVALRVVEFRNMGINFVMTVNSGALAGAPHSHIATVYTAPEAEAPLLRAASDAYPNITAIRVRDAIERVTEALNGLTTATRYGAAATLLTGFIVLIGAAAAGERRRVFEAAVLKTLGASRKRILTSFALRSAMMGAAAGIVAIAAGALGGWAVMTQVMEASYRFDAVSALVIVLGGAFASLLAGLAFAWRPLGVRPARVLRAQD